MELNDFEILLIDVTLFFFKGGIFSYIYIILPVKWLKNEKNQ